MYYIYIIRMSDESLYTGITTDLNRRMREHVLKLKTAASYTKSRDVICLESVWIAEDRSSASKLEAQIKKLPKIKKEALIDKPDSIEYQVYQFTDKYFKKIKG